jgi:tetratricopeptide (TPR) repeat protein
MTRRWNGRPAWLLMMAAFAVLVLAESAFAQGGTIRGVVRDAAGQPVADAVVAIESQQARTLQAKTNERGEYLQIGLPSGQYRVTVTKDKMGAEPTIVSVRAGQPVVADFVIAPMGAVMTAADAEAAKERIAELQRLFEEGVAASNAQQYDAAIEKFNQAIQINPNCFDCYNNIGYIHTQQKQFDQAEAAYKQSTVVKPDDPVAYNGLAAIYNAQRRFDEAAAASAKATELAGAGGAGTGGADANALYNQGVILWNGGKIAEAKVAFENAVAADPNHAEAHYQLGMALVNEGNMAGAATEFETYLKLAPSGPNAPTAKSLLSQLKPQ